LPGEWGYTFSCQLLKRAWLFLYKLAKAYQEPDNHNRREIWTN
jgi:hypothetical protein